MKPLLVFSALLCFCALASGEKSTLRDDFRRLTSDPFFDDMSFEYRGRTSFGKYEPPEVSDEDHVRQYFEELFPHLFLLDCEYRQT